MIPDPSMLGGKVTLSPSSMSVNGSAPRCEHLDGLVPVAPRSDDCRECLAQTDGWKALRLCLTCGWVACSDDSPNQHAKAHYAETDHPIAGSMEPGSRWRWCYAHQRQV
ncbi:UBP-type zinc finger domain-containing protein [Spirillospora sp. NPDC048911]|uniref:UBP-type zinc finger domain-containing protein n=1 Tax=Spirillospora sp. NPDC048911 TaxID=3364527 RepID=UPI00371989C6